MVERIHLLLTKKSKDKESEQLWKESGTTIVGSLEWYEKTKEHSSNFGSHRAGLGGGVPGFWVIGKSMLLGQ